MPGGLAARAPLPLQRQRAEHDRLRRALRARAGRLAGRVVEVGEHPDAALLDLRRLRVLGVVDVVAVQVVGDHALRLGLHPRRDEGREVAQRDAVEHELLAEQPHRVGGRHPGGRQRWSGASLSRNALPYRLPLVATSILVTVIWISPLGACTGARHQQSATAAAAHHPEGMNPAGPVTAAVHPLDL